MENFKVVDFSKLIGLKNATIDIVDRNLLIRTNDKWFTIKSDILQKNNTNWVGNSILEGSKTVNIKNVIVEYEDVLCSNLKYYDTIIEIYTDVTKYKYTFACLVDGGQHKTKAKLYTVK